MAANLAQWLLLWQEKKALKMDEKVINLELEREICCAASASLWFLHSLRFCLPCFCRRRTEYQSAECGHWLSTFVKKQLDMSNQCPSFYWCLPKWALIFHSTTLNLNLKRGLLKKVAPQQICISSRACGNVIELLCDTDWIIGFLTSETKDCTKCFKCWLNMTVKLPRVLFRNSWLLQEVRL